MRRRLSILPLLFLWNVPVPGQEPNPSAKQGQHGKNTGKDQQQPTKPTRQAVLDTQTAPQAQNERDDKKQEKKDVTVPAVEFVYLRPNAKDWMDKVTLGLSVVLVIAAVCGVCYARGTLKTITSQLSKMATANRQMNRMITHAGTQAQSALEAASAAKLNAQAVVNSERPWIAIRVESPSVNSFVFRAVNVGRTPANVTAIWTSKARIPRGSGNVPLADAFSSEPPESVIDFAPCFLPPTADCVIGMYSMRDLVGNETEEVLLRWVNEGFAMIYFYGRIVYYDTLEPTMRRETRFYYRHLPFDSSLPIPDPDCPERNTYK